MQSCGSAPLCALPNNPTDRVETWRAFGLLGFFFNDEEKLENKGRDTFFSEN